MGNSPVLVLLKSHQARIEFVHGRASDCCFCRQSSETNTPSVKPAWEAKQPLMNNCSPNYHTFNLILTEWLLGEQPGKPIADNWGLDSTNSGPLWSSGLFCWSTWLSTVFKTALWLARGNQAVVQNPANWGSSCLCGAWLCQFLGYSSAVRPVPGKHCTAIRRP